MNKLHQNISLETNESYDYAFRYFLIAFLVKLQGDIQWLLILFKGVTLSIIQVYYEKC